MNWYAYIGGNPLMASSYYYIPFDPNCGAGCEICALFLNDSSTTSPGVISFATAIPYIPQALATSLPQPGGVQQVVVYMKNC